MIAIKEQNPFRWIKVNSQTNGQDDQEFDSIKLSRLFGADLPNSSHLPAEYRHIQIREVIFICNYQNLYIVHEAILADGEVEGFSSLIPAVCTSHNDYLDVGERVNMDKVTVSDTYIKLARSKALSFFRTRQTEILSHENWLN